MKKQTIYLIRHAQDDETVRGGWSNIGLCQEGILQAKRLSEYIFFHKNIYAIERLFSSDLARALQTAKPVSKALNLEIELMPEFRETNNGVLAGKPHTDAEKEFPNLYYNTLDWEQSYPQGESPRIFFERITHAWEVFLQKIANNKSVALVTHAGVINVIQHIVTNTHYSNKNPLIEKIDYTGIIVLKFDKQQWSIDKLEMVY